MIFMMETLLLLLGMLFCNTVTILAQSCADEILIFPDAGKIQSSSSYASVGESVLVTCSTKCAWNWHTIYVDGSTIGDSTGLVLENEEVRVRVEHKILNCPSCSEPDDINCNDDSQGPLQSIINVTLLQPGAHYVQCFAHLFRPDSDLWPSNRIITVPSRAIRIDGREEIIVTQTTPASTVLSTSTFSTSTYSISSSIIPMEFVTTSSSDITQHHTTTSDQVKSTELQSSSTTTAEYSMVASNSMTVVRPVQTIMAANSDAQSSCDLLSENNTPVFVALGALAVICLLLTVAVVVLICANIRNKTRYEKAIPI